MSWYADVEITWHIHYEHRLSFAYHWTPKEIDQTAAVEIFGHLVLIRRREAADRQFACYAGCFSDLQPSARKEISNGLSEEMNAGRRRLSEYEVADPMSRITMIGTSLRVHGQRWADKHPGEVKWLAEQRVSQEEAMRRSEAWMTEQMSDEFWE